MITICLFLSLVSLILNCKLSCVVICVWTRVEIKKSVDINVIVLVGDDLAHKWPRTSLLNPRLNIFHYNILSNMKFKASPHNCTIESEHSINSLVVVIMTEAKKTFSYFAHLIKGYIIDANASENSSLLQESHSFHRRYIWLKTAWFQNVVSIWVMNRVTYTVQLVVQLATFRIVCKVRRHACCRTPTYCRPA